MSWTRRAPLENRARVRERAAVPVASAASSETPVAALVTAARDGDRAAFAALYHRFARVVHAIALARVRAADAGDVVQDVFLVAYERLGELRDPAAFPGWLVQIARNRAVDRARAPRGVDATVDKSIDPAPTAEAREALDAIRALPEAYRETLIMRLVEGLTGPEIAERTGLAPGSVRVNLHRGMMILRERLGAAPADDREGEGEP
jgi:RNA polymerase sigma-70 factor (ECF subfamily)